MIHGADQRTAAQAASSVAPGIAPIRFLRVLNGTGPLLADGNNGFLGGQDLLKLTMRLETSNRSDVSRRIARRIICAIARFGG
jgi:hypothetical protein